MKRSDINRGYHRAVAFFKKHHWTLPPQPAWDITDFGLGDFKNFGLTLVTLANEREYAEKIMYVRQGQVTPCHTHAKKKEDIICRAGRLTLQLWKGQPGGKARRPRTFTVPVNGQPRLVTAGRAFTLTAGSRVTLLPGVWHAFYAASAECLIGEVSTANDDLHDNFFLDPAVGRFPEIDEDEPPAIRLVSDR
jgi:D-lyxose ketol-isomerase